MDKACSSSLHLWVKVKAITVKLGIQSLDQLDILVSQLVMGGVVLSLGCGCICYCIVLFPAIK